MTDRTTHPGDGARAGDASVSRERVRTERSRSAPTSHGSPATFVLIGGGFLVGGLVVLGMRRGIFVPLPPEWDPVLTALGAWAAMAFGAYFAWRGWRNATETVARTAPWKTDGFTSPILRDSHGYPMGIMLLQPLLLLAGAAYLLSAYPLRDEVGPTTPGIAGMVALAGGLGTAVWLGIVLLRRRKYGEGKLILRRLPLQLGAEAEMAFRGSRSLRGLPLTVRLECLEQTFHAGSGGSHGGGSTRTHRIYREERRLQTDPSGTLELAFDLPGDLPGTRLRVGQSEAATYWRLRIHADAPGLDYRGEFLLPVYPPAQGARAGAPAR